MSVDPILSAYEARLEEIRGKLARIRVRRAIASTVLLIAVLTCLILSFGAVRQGIPVLWPLLPVPIAAVSAIHYRQLQGERSCAWKLLRHYERAIERVRGLWGGKGHKGLEFDDADHLYAKDLGIFGNGSLFEFLCVARTAVGQRTIADWLLRAATVDEVNLRQQAVVELKGKTDLRERMAVVGEFEDSESTWESFAGWLNSPPFLYPRMIRAAAAVSSTLVAAIVLAALFGMLPWAQASIWIVPFAAFQAGVALVWRRQVAEILEFVGCVSIEARTLREGLALLERQQFHSAQLRGIVEKVGSSSKSIRKLERVLRLLDQRDKEWFSFAFLLLLGKTQLCMAVEHWRAKYGPAMREWLEAWGAFEALNALATYAAEDRSSTFPVVAEGPAGIEAASIGHPLLPKENCIGNDVTLNHATRFYVISGSNMAGKSTLLRAIGLNAVLAFAGAPVRAKALKISPMTVCASISVVDSVLNGKSKFLAEVDRIRRMMEASRTQGRVLFLMDEIFSGTNSRDRRVAAEAVVRALLNADALGALSTHDMSLAEIADAVELQGLNVHMGSSTDGEPLNFDYQLKPGIAKQTNALAIARMAGVPV